MSPHSRTLPWTVALGLAAACGEPVEAETDRSTEAPADGASADEGEQHPDPGTSFAPDFTLPSIDGEDVTLSELRGNVVVLEWFNPDCPYVVQAHTRGPLRDLAAEWTERGVTWLAINSGAPGQQGTGADHNRERAAALAMVHAVLLDESGDTGRAYGATRTPELFVIDAHGRLAWRGPLDNAPMGNAPEKRTDHLVDALEAVVAGRDPAPVGAAPYGCTVRYGE